MSHYDEYYEDIYNTLVKDTKIRENDKKSNFINNLINCTDISYEDAEQNINNTNCDTIWLLVVIKIIYKQRRPT
jgi:hypothetical protein